MATVAASALRAVQKPSTHPHDRKFYTGMSIAMALTVVAGFAPTYYAKLLGSAPLVTVSNAPFNWTVHVHGALFSAWVMLFVVQTALVASHRVAVHRRLGIAGGVLAVAMVGAGLTLAIQAAKRGTAPPGLTATQFLVIPLFDMLMFASFVTAALWQRRNKEAHKRLMLLAYISIIAAAVARLPGVLPHGPLLFYGLTFIFLVVAVTYDVVTRRRLHTVYRWGGAALVASVPIRLILSGTAAWRSFAESLIH